jgi:hypothetical protein
MMAMTMTMMMIKTINLIRLNNIVIVQFRIRNNQILISTKEFYNHTVIKNLKWIVEMVVTTKQILMRKTKKMLLMKIREEKIYLRIVIILP